MRPTPLRRIAATFAVLALASGAAACADEPQTPSGTPTGAAVSYPVTVGGVTLDAQPQKIVSLSPTTTEMLFAIDAGTQVTAVDDQSNYPADAPKTDLSGYQPNAEAIAAKNPDLVVLTTDANNIVSQLGALKIPVYVASAATTLDDTYKQLTELGALTGHPAEAAAEVQRMKDQIAKIIASVPQRATPLTYYYELDPTFYSVTSKTFVGSLFAQLGLTNIADAADTKNSGYPQLSAEAIIKANPDLIFLADAKCCGQSAEAVAKRAGWAGITAVAKNQVVALDDDIASRWGPRVVDLLQTAADAVAKVPAS
ncbi:ABC transporter substrate-binding protein [Luedemannella helvata]|uniref:ABC transporter substrate-binding protein n=1 Tax=Luedemannella helvata TaxID=349315 RepID=A0ABP4VW60_9ACTN